MIDDLYGEALEIKDAGNTWLTYGPPMQLARVRYIYRAPLKQLPLSKPTHLQILSIVTVLAPDMLLICACSTSG